MVFLKYPTILGYKIQFARGVARDTFMQHSLTQEIFMSSRPTQE